MKIPERLIPPPIVGAVSAVMAWIIAVSTASFTVRSPILVPAAAILITCGLVLDAWSILRFLGAGTSINPVSSDKTTVIVRTGPYRFTRNPMYLGMALLLVGYCVYLGNVVSLLAVVLYVWYTTRFQIIPEEKALTAMFGESYRMFLAETRRWI